MLTTATQAAQCFRVADRRAVVAALPVDAFTQDVDVTAVPNSRARSDQSAHCISAPRSTHTERSHLH
jgi:hypothetical protein